MPKRNPLVCQHLENVSRDLLEQHLEFIRQYVRGRQGVYALYRRSKIYYVGLAGNLRSHLAHHLNDRHHDSWDRFSVYITTDDNHLRELESLEPYAVAMEKTLTQRPQRLALRIAENTFPLRPRREPLRPLR